MLLSSTARWLNASHSPKNSIKHITNPRVEQSLCVYQCVRLLLCVSNGEHKLPDLKSCYSVVSNLASNGCRSLSLFFHMWQHLWINPLPAKAHVIIPNTSSLCCSLLARSLLDPIAKLAEPHNRAKLNCVKVENNPTPLRFSHLWRIFLQCFHHHPSSSVFLFHVCRLSWNLPVLVFLSGPICVCVCVFVTVCGYFFSFSCLIIFLLFPLFFTVSSHRQER